SILHFGADVITGNYWRHRFILPQTEIAISFDFACTVPFFCGDLEQTMIVRTPHGEVGRVCLVRDYSDIDYRVQIYRLKNGNFLIETYDDAVAIIPKPTAIQHSAAGETNKNASNAPCERSTALGSRLALKYGNQDEREYLGAFDDRGRGWGR